MKDQKITVDEFFLKRFFKITDTYLDENEEITMAMLRKNLDIIENQMQELQDTAKKNKSRYQRKNDGPVLAEKHFSANGDENSSETKKTIFVIDDLGVITYQLKTVFEHMGYEVIISNEVYGAIEKFKRSMCDVVLMDLFIPTEREGFLLLKELKKLTATTQRPVKIGVMTASTKKEHKQICKMHGAEFYVEKIEDWQDQLTQIIKNLD